MIDQRLKCHPNQGLKTFGNGIIYLFFVACAQDWRLCFVKRNMGQNPDQVMVFVSLRTRLICQLAFYSPWHMCLVPLPFRPGPALPFIRYQVEVQLGGFITMTQRGHIGAPLRNFPNQPRWLPSIVPTFLIDCSSIQLSNCVQ